MERDLLFVRRLLNAEQNEAVRWGDSEAPCRTQVVSRGSEWISQHKNNP